MGKNLKTDCKTFQHYIGDFIDNEISPALQYDLKKHMEICASCNNIYKGFLTVSRRLKKLDSIQTSPDFKSELLQRIHGKMQPSANAFSLFKANVFKKYRAVLYLPVYAALAITISFFLMKSHINPFLPFQQENRQYSSSTSMKNTKSLDEVSIFYDDPQSFHDQEENKPTTTVQTVSENLLILELDESIAQNIIF